jgi:hypothetical protein
VAGDVFISYAHDDKLTADAVCNVLERNEIRCWIAPRDIVYGQGYGVAIVEAIENTKIMVLMLSARANASQHVQREVERAVHNAKIIIPVRIEDVRPSKDLEFFISTPHWLDAFPPSLQDHYFNKLANSIKVLLGQADTLPAPPPPPLPSPSLAPPGSGVGSVDDRTVEYDYWSDIKASKDPCDFETFLEKFPRGTYEPRARRRVEELLPKTSLDLAQRFLHEHPESSRVKIAGARLVELEWSQVEKARDAAALRAFIARYPASPQSRPAKLALAKQEWSRLHSSKNADEIERVFADLPDTPEASLAQRWVARLRQDAAAWAGAAVANDTASFRRYLREFPTGEHAADARARLKAMGQEEGPRELSYQTIAIVGVVAGLVAHVFTQMGLYAVRLGGTANLLSAHRALYVAFLVLLVAKLSRTRRLEKVGGAFVALYVIEVLLDSIPRSGLTRMALDVVIMLLEWLFMAWLFASPKDKGMIGIAAAVGLAQGLVAVAVLDRGADSTLAYFFLSAFGFATTGLCIAYGIRRQIEGRGAASVLA